MVRVISDRDLAVRRLKELAVERRKVREALRGLQARGARPLLPPVWAHPVPRFKPAPMRRPR